MLHNDMLHNKQNSILNSATNYTLCKKNFIKSEKKVILNIAYIPT